jgi:hypothetical protein
MSKRNQIHIPIMTFIFVLVLCVTLSIAASDNGGTATYQQYREAIQKEYGIDINNFSDTMKGGRADAKDITKYNLIQLLMGIRVESEHTTNKMIALEITMDHLEEFPYYYTRLEKMEKEMEKEQKAKEKQ